MQVGTRERFMAGRLIAAYIPMLCAVIMVAHSIFDFMGIYLRVFSYIGGTSLLVWVLFLWDSFLYRLCAYQRMFTYYLIFGNTLAVIDNYLHLPVSDVQYMLIYCISFGITTLIYGYLRLRENKRL